MWLLVSYIEGRGRLAGAGVPVMVSGFSICAPVFGWVPWFKSVAMISVVFQSVLSRGVGITYDSNLIACRNIHDRQH